MWPMRGRSKSDFGNRYQGGGVECQHVPVIIDEQRDGRAPRPVSRREVIKYVSAAPVLLGLGMATATLAAPNASAADMRLIDFTHRLVPPDQIKSAGFDGALVYVSELRPGADFDFKPVTREYADATARGGPPRRQLLSIRKARLADTIGLHARIRGRRCRRPDSSSPSCSCRGPGFGADLLQCRRGHRSRCLEQPCCSMVSGDQLGIVREPHRHLRARQRVWLGYQGRRDWGFHDHRTRVGVADEGVV